MAEELNKEFNTNKLHRQCNNIQIIEVQNEEQLREFVAFAQIIYADYPMWPGQNDEDEIRFFDPQYNLTLGSLGNNIKIAKFLALRDGIIVGRISANINNFHNEYWKNKTGFFGHFECVNDQKVADMLFEVAENWIKSNGQDEIWGPFSFTHYDIIGCVVQGFDSRPTMGLAYTPPYYLDLVQNAGYAKVRDVVEVLAPVEKHFNVVKEKCKGVDHLHERFKVRTFDKNHIEEELLALSNIFADSFSPSGWATRPMEDGEWEAAVCATLPFIPEELFLIVEDHETPDKPGPVAFLLHMDDHNEIMYNKRNNLEGRITRIKAFVIAIKQEYQGLGIGKWISYLAAEKMLQMGYEEVSFSWIDAENQKSISLSTGMGGHIDKVYRIFGKQL